jgi:hypothetical protein
MLRGMVGSWELETPDLRSGNSESDVIRADAKKLIKSEYRENALYYEFFEAMVGRLRRYDGQAL